MTKEKDNVPLEPEQLRCNAIIKHKGLIHMCLRDYIQLADLHSSVEKEDLIQEGWCAIIKKIDSHDPKRGAMSTHLCLWINDAMRQYLLKRSTYSKRYYDRKTKVGLMGSINLPLDVKNIEEVLPHSISPEEELIGFEEALKHMEEFTSIPAQRYRANAGRPSKKYQLCKKYLEVQNYD